MANAKISDSTVFVTTITDITDIDGFAAYATTSGTGNASMSGNQIVTSLEANLDLANFTTGILPVTRGGTGVGTLADGHLLLGSGANAISTLDLTTKGSLVVGDGAIDPIALPVGTDGQVLTADSTEVSGLKWETASSGGDNVQTLSTLTWDYNNGNSAIFTPADNGTSPIDVLVPSNFPNGARGSLKVLPTNTIKFGLFANSKLPSSQNVLQISAVNPTILHYFYDGTDFYWFYDINYIDPINQSPDPTEPTVGGTNLLGFWFPGSTALADGAGVPLGTTWDISLPSPGPGLIGNLTRTGTGIGAAGMTYSARDEVAQEAPYWDFVGDAAWEATVATPGGGASIDDWGLTFYFRATSGTSTTSYEGIADPNTNDDEGFYMYQRELCISESGLTFDGIQGNFPLFTAANNLQDEWVFCHIDVLLAANLVLCYIGTQSSFNASTNQGGSGTITGEDGNPITLTPDGLYIATTSLSYLSDGGMSTIIYGGANGNGSTIYEFEGNLGLAAFYNGQISAAQVTGNWNDTREFYYIN